ncbi:MAG: hypothetical protein CVV13_12355 [Gammaproteobacteria bacterium HGW-Gammaproteobacteria-3]|nr:MAG: hypothetical protein CVV13_12355 [Gammaproteobacteria bacterium HGW-Gammaproteobacteria-3]
MAQEQEQTATISGKKYTVTGLLKVKDEYIRLEAVDKCFALRELVNDPSVLVRMAVARKGVGHSSLVRDLNWRVRATVAKYSTDEHILNTLIQDEHEFVRFVLVKRRHALEYFQQDSDAEISAIAKWNLNQKEVPESTSACPTP